MAYDLTDKLVVAVASSALFDLSISNEIFQTKGEEAYRNYQRKNEKKVLTYFPKEVSHPQGMK